MLKAIVRFLEKTNNIDRSTYIWNTVSATVLAMQGPVIQAVVSRTNVFDSDPDDVCGAVRYKALSGF